MMSKYECFLAELNAAVVVADARRGEDRAAQAIDTIINPQNGTNSLPSIINAQIADTPTMVNDYIAYVWDGGDKPTWLAQAGF